MIQIERGGLVGRGLRLMYNQESTLVSGAERTMELVAADERSTS
jgi:hypothetical protein